VNAMQEEQPSYFTDDRYPVKRWPRTIRRTNPKSRDARS